MCRDFLELEGFLGIRRNFLGILRKFIGFEEITWKSVDAAQDARPRDRPGSPFVVRPMEFHACEVAPRAPQNVRSAPAGQLFLGNAVQFGENRWNSWECAGIPWNSKKASGIRRLFLGI